MHCLPVGTKHIRENLQEISVGRTCEHLGKCADAGHTLSVYHIGVTVKSRSTMWKAIQSAPFSLSLLVCYSSFSVLVNK